MKRILLMVITNIIHVPWWFYKIDKMGKNPQQYSEEERYHYLRKRLRRINRRGRVKVVTVGGIPMDRSDIRSSMEIIKEMASQVKKGRNFVIFPEGTRSRKGNEILAFKAGTFKSAVKAGCPIIPVALINSFRPFDISSIKKERVQVHFLKAIYPEQYMGLKTVEIADLVHNKIQEEINKYI